MPRAIQFLSLILLLCASAAQPFLAAEMPPKAVIAYLFVKDRVIGPNEVAASKLTRINYAFANLKEGEIVEGFSHDRENFQILNGLKQQNPALQVLVSVGGWTWSGGFSDMALTRESRKKFIDSAVRFVRRYHLDGIDIDWEYPGSPGIGNPFRSQDKQNYTALLQELRGALDTESKTLGRTLFTSVATGASPNFLTNTEMNQVQRYVDSVNLMSYDYYEADSDSTTGHNAPLYANPADPKHVSDDESVSLYEKAGVPAQKIVLGVPFYGHAWADVNAKNHGLFQPGKKTNLEADYKAIAGTLLKNGFIRYWDSASSAPYLYNPASRTFVSFDDAESMDLKCQYVLKHRLRGVMFWEYSGDSDHALLNTIDRALGRMPQLGSVPQPASSGQGSN